MDSCDKWCEEKPNIVILDRTAFMSMSFGQCKGDVHVVICGRMLIEDISTIVWTSTQLRALFAGTRGKISRTYDDK